MKLSDLAQEPVSPDPHIMGLAVDSRKVAQGFLFAAIPGEKVDGRDFITQAEQKGAAGILSVPGAKTNLPLIVDAEPRRRLAQMAAKFYGQQPEFMCGVTGTNGKTSVAQFTSQLFALLGCRGGSVGTLGAFGGDGFARKLNHTTPPPIDLHKTLSAMAEAELTHVAMEVSSHALAQYRADGVRFYAAAFTNITRDHLDFHASFEDYVNAKARLFLDLLPEGAPVVINLDGAGGGDMLRRAEASGRNVLSVGREGKNIRIESVESHAQGLTLDVACDDKSYNLDLPLVGSFQAENVIVAAVLVMAHGFAATDVLPLTQSLKNVPGRMQHVTDVKGAGVYVDYAHTPGAVETALKAIRPHVEKRLIVVLGAGGDRDREKRPLMGKAACENADIIIVTDDNPRTEDASVIREAVMQGCARAIEVVGRAEAIEHGVNLLGAGDVLVIAGKGHEQGQVVGEKTLPFDDAQVANAAALKLAEDG